MIDWDAELDFAQREERKFFRDGVWTPYLAARKWRRRFWWAMLVIAILLALLGRGRA